MILFIMPSVTFFLRSNNDSSDSHALYCRVTLNGTNSEFSLKEKVDPKKWDQKKQRISGSGVKPKYLRALMDNVSYGIKSLALVKKVETAKDLIHLYRQPQSKPLMLADIVKNYIAAAKSNISYGTLRNHEVKLQNLNDFEEYCSRKFTPTTFDLQIAEKFKDWYMKRANTTNVDTANRNLLLYKTALIHAQRKGEIKEFGIMYYVGKKDPKKPTVFLTMQDLEKITTPDFVSPMLDRIRDLFLFQCFTGLSYADIWNDWEIKETETGTVLTGNRAKNGHSFFVPLNDVAIQILEKYNYNLPKYTNEVFNRVLKEIAAICGIKKRISTHTGRKTFATLKDSEGWSRETISKMLGHKTYRTTEMYYLGDSFARVENEMKQRNSA